MRRTCCVLVLLLSCLGAVATASGQDAGVSGGTDPEFRLEQNYPNPFNPETKIPFVLDDGLFRDGPVAVSLRIYNVLQQYVATPTALNHPGGEGAPVDELEYRAPGRYEAYWDGTDRSGREVASGVYFVQLVVDGRTEVRKMFVTK